MTFRHAQMSPSLPKFAETPLCAGTAHKDHNRFDRRWEMVFLRNRHAIQNRIVLDLACNTGRMSYPCILLGAKKIVGVEARKELIEKGRAVFDNLGIDKHRMEWHQADVFQFLAKLEPG